MFNPFSDIDSTPRSFFIPFRNFQKSPKIITKIITKIISETEPMSIFMQELESIYNDLDIPNMVITTENVVNKFGDLIVLDVVNPGEKTGIFLNTILKNLSKTMTFGERSSFFNQVSLNVQSKIPPVLFLKRNVGVLVVKSFLSKSKPKIRANTEKNADLINESLLMLNNSKLLRKIAINTTNKNLILESLGANASTINKILENKFSEITFEVDVERDNSDNIIKLMDDLSKESVIFGRIADQIDDFDSDDLDTVVKRIGPPIVVPNEEFDE